MSLEGAELRFQKLTRASEPGTAGPGPRASDSPPSDRSRTFGEGHGRRRASLSAQLQLLQQAVEVINSCAREPEFEAAFDGLQQAVTALLDCEVSTLYLVEDTGPRTKRLWAKKVRRKSIMEMPFGSGVAGLVAEYGRSMSIPEAQSCKHFDPGLEARLGCDVRNILSSPVRDVSGKQVAVLEAVNKRGGTFMDTDKHLLQLISSFLGNSLTLSRLQLSALTEQTRMASLCEGFRMLQLCSSSLDGLVNSISRIASELVSAQHMLLMFMDQLNNKLWTHWSLGSTPIAAEGPCVHLRGLDSGPLFEALSSKVHVLAYDIAADSVAPTLAELLGGEQLASVLVQPVVDAKTGAVLAVLLAANKTSGQGAAFAARQQPVFDTRDEAALAVWAIEVAGVLAGRTLELSFASAIASTANDMDSVDTALKAQLLSYANHQPVLPVPQTPFGLLAEFSQGDTVSSIDHAESSAESSLSLSAAHSGFGLLDSLDSTPANSLHPFDRAAWKAANMHSKAVKHSLEKRKSGNSENALGDAIKAGRMALDQKLAGNLDLHRWDMNLCETSPDDLLRFAADIFAASGVVDYFNLEEWRLSTFIASAASLYQPNPYHNFVHACYVLHATFMVIHASQSSCALSKPAQLALLIAALCHDMDHDGHTNNFHVHTKSALALCYNDTSVMENHHCSLAYSILNREDCKLLAQLAPALQQEIRRLVIGAIMATDITQHFALTSSFCQHGTVWSLGSSDDVLLLCKAILHAADLSNPARPFPINAAMSMRLHKEFKAQVKEERVLGLLPEPHMEAESHVIMCSLEASFIEAVALPMWEHLAACFPALTPAVLRMELNHNLYNALSHLQDSQAAEVYQMAETDRVAGLVNHPRWIHGEGAWHIVQDSIRKGKANPVGLPRQPTFSCVSDLLDP